MFDIDYYMLLFIIINVMQTFENVAQRFVAFSRENNFNILRKKLIEKYI